MLYERVFRRIFRRWVCDHDPVEYDKEVHKTSGNNGYFDVFSYYVYTHTTRFYKCSFCGHKTKDTKTTGEKIEHNRGTYWR